MWRNDVTFLLEARYCECVSAFALSELVEMRKTVYCCQLCPVLFCSQKDVRCSACGLVGNQGRWCVCVCEQGRKANVHLQLFDCACEAQSPIDFFFECLQKKTWLRRSLKSVHLNLEVNEHIMWKQEFQIFLLFLVGTWLSVFPQRLRGSTRASNCQPSGMVSWPKLSLWEATSVFRFNSHGNSPNRRRTSSALFHSVHDCDAVMSSFFAKESWCCTWKPACGFDFIYGMVAMETGWHK